MTEAEWLGGGRHGRMLAHVGEKAGARRLRLFACACCRRCRGLFADRRSRAAVEALERAAAGGRGAGAGGRRAIFGPWRPLNPGRSAARPATSRHHRSMNSAASGAGSSYRSPARAPALPR